MLKGLFTLLLPWTLLGEVASFSLKPSDWNSSTFTKCHILDSVSLSYGRIEGEKFFGISALAYDSKRDLLYMLNDRGRLFAFWLEIKNDRIVSIRPYFSKRLRDIRGRKFFIRQSDTEGMTLIEYHGNKRLLISFEQRPKIGLFDLLGREIEAVSLTTLSPSLHNTKAYLYKNGMLESVAYSSKYGVITSPEFPLKTTKEGLHGIYNQKGLLCYIKKGVEDLAITELTMMEDGMLLALQRGVVLKGGIGFRMQLLKIDLTKREKGICRSEVLLHASSDEGWMLDNFEGMTALGNNRYLIVSDDNANPFQKTLLVLFRLDKEPTD